MALIAVGIVGCFAFPLVNRVIDQRFTMPLPEQTDFTLMKVSPVFEIVVLIGCSLPGTMCATSVTVEGTVR